MYFLAQGRIRPLLAALASFLALTCLTAFILGLDSYHDYVQIVLPAQTRFRSLGYNYAVAGFWHKLFDPAGEAGWMTPLWSSPMLASIGTLLSDLVITVIVAILVYLARTHVQRELAFASVVTAMLLVSPVTWDTSLPLLLIPIAVIANSVGSSRWMAAALVLILMVLWMPQVVLTRLALAGHSIRVANWAFMLGAPSLKFYALLGIFALGLTICRAELVKSRLNGVCGDTAL